MMNFPAQFQSCIETPLGWLALVIDSGEYIQRELHKLDALAAQVEKEDEKPLPENDPARWLKTAGNRINARLSLIEKRLEILHWIKQHTKP